MKPARIHRKRTKGWKMPDNTVYVGRPTLWGNPFEHDGSEVSKRRCASHYRDLMTGGVSHFIERNHRTRDYTLGDVIFAQKLEAIRGQILAHIHLLGGQNLACWCPLHDEFGDRFPCHADVLLELANPDH